MYIEHQCYKNLRLASPHNVNGAAKLIFIGGVASCDAPAKAVVGSREECTVWEDLHFVCASSYPPGPKVCDTFNIRDVLTL